MTGISLCMTGISLCMSGILDKLTCMTFSTQDSYIMGTQESVDVLVEVVNLGEDAYESQAIIELPPEVDYINVQHIEVNYTAIPV